jgi:hypothetical protein
LLRNVKGTCIGMSESRTGITNGAEMQDCLMQTQLAAAPGNCASAKPAKSKQLSLFDANHNNGENFVVSADLVNHEFDSANARASSPGIAQEVGGKPLQRAAGLGAKLVGDLATSISREPGRRTAPLGRPEACFAGLEVTQQPPRDYLHRFVVGCWRQHPCCERATCRARACSRDSRYQPPLSYESRACEHTHTHAQMHT